MKPILILIISLLIAGCSGAQSIGYVQVGDSKYHYLIGKSSSILGQSIKEMSVVKETDKGTEVVYSTSACSGGVFSLFSTAVTSAKSAMAIY